jgi:hypothetical protein
VRCGRCGNDNSEANRFCGMCGAPLVAKTQAAGQSTGQRPAVAPPGSIAAARQATVPEHSVPVQTVPVQTTPVQTAARPAPGASATAERRPAAVSPPDGGPSTRPIIAGPSFLGLNLPASGARADRHSDPRADPSAGRDSLQPSSGNLDYLLEDEEEPKRGWGKLMLVVVALALALGFGYLHWRQGGFDWLKVGDKKQVATGPASEAAPGGADSGTADSGGATGTAASPDGAAPQAGTSGTATGGGVANPADSSAPQATPSQIDSQAAASPTTAAQSKPGDSSAPADTASPPASSDSDKRSAQEESPTGARARAAKPTAAKAAAARPVDAVSEAERYIYGRGVRQDCDRGMRLLKAAEQSNPKAMISLGALYSTGTCAPRDLPTAYRWFALALHKQPDNPALQDDLQRLWSRMTQPERQLAIKLSQ